MPTCPNCKQQATRRKKHCCPNCGVWLESYRTRGKNPETIWVYESVDTNELVSLLESLISMKYQIDFKFESRLPELGMARTLYVKCGLNQTLAKEVIYAYYDPDIPRTTLWCKFPKSLATVLWDNVNDAGRKGCFSIALAIARDRTRRKEKIVQRQLTV